MKADLRCPFDVLAAVVSIVVSLAGCGGASRTDSPDPSITVLPMKLHGAHATIEVTINGQPAVMVLDTGADQIVLSAAAAERLSLDMRDTAIPGVGGGGTYFASTTSIAELRVGDLQQRVDTVYVVALPDEFHYDGALGTPFFAQFVTTVDYERCEVVLRSGAVFEPPADAARVAIKTDFGGLFVIASAAGITGWYSVDTGAGNALTMHTPTVAQYGLREAFVPAVDMITGVGAGGYTAGRVVRMPVVTLGPHVFNDVVVELSNAGEGSFASSRSLGNLGGELWRRFTVTIDYSGGEMYLAPNSEFNARFEGPRSGLSASLRDGAIEIIDVVDASPAADAGVRIGEQIIAVNGARVDSTDGAADRISLDAVSRALRGPSGSQVQLLVRDRSGSERELNLVLRELL